MIRQVDTLIVGGGPTGLAVAYALQGDTLVVERDRSVGGLCRSIERDGGVFDIGGHSFHTPHPEVHDLVNTLLGGGLFTQQRNAQVFTHGVLIPYPFQRFYDRIPDPEVVRECEEGLRTARGEAEQAGNFEEYIIRKFGDGVARHFMLPYNRKLWARDLKDVSCEWTTQRVAGAKGEQDRFDTHGGVRKPLQPDTVVAYPRDGGFEEIFKAFVPAIPEVMLNTAVVGIDADSRTALLSDGTVIGWRTLVSTMPLPVLVRVIDRTPADVIALADQLQYLSLRVELLLTEHPLDTPIQRIYSPDPAVAPHKIALNHNSSDTLRARPHHAIMAESSYSNLKPLDADRAIEQTIEVLCHAGVLKSRADIVWSGHVDVKFGYPVYTAARPQLVARIQEWLARYDMFTAGRFGEWEYINSDKCVHKGLALGASLRARGAATAGSIAS
jgi:UDP-galactopyranose mutase